MLGFADEQMEVLGHDDVAHNNEMIFAADLFEGLQKKIAVTGCSQQWTALEATGRDEVQISGAVISLETLGHVNNVRFYAR